MGTCRLCRATLDTCAVLNACDTCTDCARKALHNARRNTRAVVVATDEWAIFTAALRQAASVSSDGLVHMRNVRPLIRGRVFHKSIGGFYRRAEDEGLITAVDREPSSDVIGRNTNKTDRIFALGVKEVAA